MAFTLYDKNGVKLVVSHAVDAKEAIANGILFKNDPTQRKAEESVKTPAEKTEPIFEEDKNIEQDLMEKDIIEDSGNPRIDKRKKRNF